MNTRKGVKTQLGSLRQNRHVDLSESMNTRKGVKTVLQPNQYAEYIQSESMNTRKGVKTQSASGLFCPRTE